MNSNTKVLESSAEDSVKEINVSKKLISLLEDKLEYELDMITTHQVKIHGIDYETNKRLIISTLTYVRGLELKLDLGYIGAIPKFLEILIDMLFTPRTDFIVSIRTVKSILEIINSDDALVKQFIDYLLSLELNFIVMPLDTVLTTNGILNNDSEMVSKVNYTLDRLKSLDSNINPLAIIYLKFYIL